MKIALGLMLCHTPVNACARIMQKLDVVIYEMRSATTWQCDYAKTQSCPCICMHSSCCVPRNVPAKDNLSTVRQNTHELEHSVRQFQPQRSDNSKKWKCNICVFLSDVGEIVPPLTSARCTQIRMPGARVNISWISPDLRFILFDGILHSERGCTRACMCLWAVQVHPIEYICFDRFRRKSRLSCDAVSFVGHIVHSKFMLRTALYVCSRHLNLSRHVLRSTHTRHSNPRLGEDSRTHSARYDKMNLDFVVDILSLCPHLNVNSICSKICYASVWSR